MTVPIPFQFNALKHHLGYIREYISEAKSSHLKNDLLTIGGSQVDLYTGALTLDEICEQIKTLLISTNIFRKEEFLSRISDFGYFKMMLYDGSEWVLRRGNDPGRYIHLHPGRYSTNSTRVKASSLKSVIACLVLRENEEIDLQHLNKVRTEVLNLSPFARIYRDKGIGKVFDLVRGKWTFNKSK